MFANSTHTAVAQVVDIVDLSFRVHHFDQVNDDGDDVFFGQHLGLHGHVEVQFFVDPVTANVSQVVAFVGEKESIDNATCRFLIGWLGIAQLSVDKFYSFFFGIGGVFLERVENDRIVDVINFLFVDEDIFDARIDDLIDVFGSKQRFAVDDHFGTFDRNYFACIFVHKVFNPATHYTGSKTAVDKFLKISFGCFYFLCQVENFEDVFVTFKANGAEKGCNGEFLFAVDVSIHHLVDVGCKFHPGTFEGDDPCREKLCTVGVEACSEESSGGAVQLRHHHTFGAIDAESAAWRHVRHLSQIDVLDNGFKVFVLRVGTV